MRSDIELLKMLRDCLLVDNNISMCSTTYVLYNYCSITFNEYNALQDLIKCMKPKEKPKECNSAWWGCGYYFNPRDIESRVTLINEFIEKLSNEKR